MKSGEDVGHIDTPEITGDVLATYGRLTASSAVSDVRWRIRLTLRDLMSAPRVLTLRASWPIMGADNHERTAVRFPATAGV